MSTTSKGLGDNSEVEPPDAGAPSDEFAHPFEDQTPPKRPGGPRTPDGKKASSKNAWRHGILSPDPTAGGESPEEYKTLLEGMREHFRPFGFYEEELVAQITGEFISLHRVTQAISSAISLRFKRIDPPRPALLLKRIVPPPLNWSTYKRPFEARFALEHLDKHPDGLILEAEVVHEAIRAIGAEGLTMPDVDQNWPSPDTAGFLREFVGRVAEGNGIDVARVIKQAVAVLEYVVDLVVGADEKVRNILAEQAQRAEREATSHLPELDEYERLLRYKRAHERSLKDYVALLETSQRARAGELDPPLRVQVSEG